MKKTMTRVEYLEQARDRAKNQWEGYICEGVLKQIQENSKYVISYQQMNVVERNMDKPWIWNVRTYPSDRSRIFDKRATQTL